MQRFRAVSRKTHRTAGIFDRNLPLTGEAAVECRNGGGNYSFVFTFGTKCDQRHCYRNRSDGIRLFRLTRPGELAGGEGWTDNATTESGYAIERCSGGGWTNFSPIATVAANTVSYFDKNVSAGTTYR